MDASNHFLVVLLWFVPVSMAVLAIVWYRSSREGAGSEVSR
jgi:cytochrome c-type biogenesis protein CcmH/NrfF